MATTAELRKKGFTRKKTPIEEEEQKREAETGTKGQAFIQRREKLAGQLGSKQQAEAQLTRESESTPEALAERQTEAQILQAQKDIQLLQATPQEELFTTPTEGEIQASLPAPITAKSFTPEEQEAAIPEIARAKRIGIKEKKV